MRLFNGAGRNSCAGGIVSETPSLSLILASENASLAEDLRAQGIEVVRTTDGFEAIRLALDSLPDAVVLDQVSTGLPVPTVAIWLKLNPHTSALPLVGLTGQPSGWQEAMLDAQVAPSEAVKNLASIVHDLTSGKTTDIENQLPADLRAFDPLEITLDLIKIYRQRLCLASAMIELAGLQNDLGDFEYTIKSILEAAGRALGSKLMAITLVREQTHYALVRETGLTKRHLDALENHSIDCLAPYFDKPLEIDRQLVIGRRRLADSTDEKVPDCRFLHHPIYSRGKVLGCLVGICADSETEQAYHASLLPDLTAQIALLLVNADLISTQEGYVDELSSILRAAVETSSISSISEKSSRTFLLQFLLIVLELCRTDRGCVILLNDQTGEIEETATLGCEANEVLASQLRNKQCLANEINSLPAGEVYVDPVQLGNSRCTRIIAPLVAAEKNIGALVVYGYSPVVSPRIAEAIKALASLAAYLAYNRSLHLKIIETSIIEHQLETAREVQLEMLPSKQPELPGFDIHGESRPAREVGGDFFDYLYHDDELGITVADVCGKSIPASLLMTMTRALFLAASETDYGPEKVLKTVNSLLCRMITQGKFVTAALTVVRADSLTYSSAGHRPLLILRAATGEFEEINPEGIALGIVTEADFESIEFHMVPGDVALLYTDGLDEAMSPDRVLFGAQKVMDVLRENASKSSRAIVDALYDSIQRHACGTDQYDDTTIVVIKRTDKKDSKNANS